MRPGDEAARERAATLMRTMAERTAWATGTAFFRELTRGLAEALDVPCAFVTEFLEQNSLARPLAFWRDAAFTTGTDYALAGTPCATVLDGAVAAVADDVAARFPDSGVELEALRAESYLAVPVIDAVGTVIGHLAVIDRRVRRWSETEIAVLQIVGPRTSGEIVRARQEREPRDARLTAEAASGATSAFLSSVSHELRTPLNGILGYAQLLARDPTLDARHREAVNSVRHCGEHLLDLVEQILSRTCVDGGQVEPSPATGVARPQTRPGPTPAEQELPPGLRAQLLEQARRGDIAALNRRLDDLERLATHPQVLAELRAHARAFDMAAIRERLRRGSQERP
jgi:signal transduction histidine kinase